jgi:heme/copper-type cytochrome/quinol oxidase subunit 3
MKKYHLYHLVNPSPWPFLTAFAMFSLVVSFVGCIHNYTGCFETFLYALVNVAGVAALWWRDVIREATFGGHHTTPVQRGLRLGFALFLVSEGMLFFSFFWAFFYLATVPAPEVGGVWPPAGIETISAGGVPLLNTYLLVWSGVALTWSHFGLLSNQVRSTVLGLLFTLALGFTFLGFQASEYYEAPFDISDGVYGSTFYLLTGFHGLHVLIGWIFLTTCLFRIRAGHFTRERHLGYEMAIWYWHFVDVIWLALYLAVYCWGGAA